MAEIAEVTQKSSWRHKLIVAGWWFVGLWPLLFYALAMNVSPVMDFIDYLTKTYDSADSDIMFFVVFLAPIIILLVPLLNNFVPKAVDKTAPKQLVRALLIVLCYVPVLFYELYSMLLVAISFW